MNIIYAYKKIKENKIVYVGQTVDLTTRHKQHFLYDPYNEKNREYNYPLSRGIRKYGEDAYELIILEDNVPLSELDNREKYWIKYYNTYWNGYNQTPGGKNPTKPFIEDSIINKIIEMLKNPQISFPDISEKTGVSITHIHNINEGKRRPQKNIEYPIRKPMQKGWKGLKFNQEEVKQIHKDLLETDLTYKELGQKYNCRFETISRINRGKTKAYKLDEYTYPLRKAYIRK